MSKKSNLIKQLTLGQSAWVWLQPQLSAPCWSFATVPSSGDQGSCASGPGSGRSSREGEGAQVKDPCMTQGSLGRTTTQWRKWRWEVRRVAVAETEGGAWRSSRRRWPQKEERWAEVEASGGTQLRHRSRHSLQGYAGNCPHCSCHLPLEVRIFFLFKFCVCIILKL